jgi:exopolyphosphatase / guanosine-5'-triphosphate,3'-diphosphate pyrophosphatase
MIRTSGGAGGGLPAGRVAVIDVGTNSVLFLLAERAGSGVAPVRQELRTTRLGRKLAAEGRIGSGDIEQTAAVLVEWKQLAGALGAERLVCVGTQVFRAASNRRDALESLFRDSGLRIEVLPEQDEAAWSYIGAVQGLPEAGRSVVMDIGGGSTEWASGNGLEIDAGRSVPVGAVTLTEKHVRNDPPTRGEMEAMRAEIRSAFLSDIPLQNPSVPFVCVGGTATTLAALELGLERYDAGRVDGTVLDRRTVGAWFSKLGALPCEARKKEVRIDPDRADILPAGLLILLSWMEAAGFPAVRVSGRGLRFGIAARELGLVSPDSARFSDRSS